MNEQPLAPITLVRSENITTCGGQEVPQGVHHEKRRKTFHLLEEILRSFNSLVLLDAKEGRLCPAGRRALRSPPSGLACHWTHPHMSSLSSVSDPELPPG